MFTNFKSAMDFLMHFQFPICYENGIELLSTLHQNTTAHILDHIHERRRWRRLIQLTILDILLVDWFRKSLLPPIS
jgi:hypothetical protein